MVDDDRGLQRASQRCVYRPGVLVRNSEAFAEEAPHRGGVRVGRGTELDHGSRAPVAMFGCRCSGELRFEGVLLSLEVASGKWGLGSGLRKREKTVRGKEATAHARVRAHGR